MIPEDKSAAVLKGIREAFGTTCIEDTRSIARALGSDLLFRIVVQGSAYLLRIMTRMDEINDPQRQFACMAAAAEAGIAPRVRYANTEDGISVTDFVEEMPFSVGQALVQLPGVVRKLHGLQPFPKTFNYVTAHNGFIWRLRKADLIPRKEIEEVFTGYEQVCSTYPRIDQDVVPCHGDLRRENIQFDGQRVWLAGWQAAFLNDRYFDLAVAASFLITNDSDEQVYLEQYFGRQPDEYQQARFFLMRQTMHMLSAAVYLILGSAGKPIRESEDLSSFEDFHARIWSGKVNLADNEMKIAYGMIHWRRLLENMRNTRFTEALGIVGERNRSEYDLRLLLTSAP